MKQLVEAPAAAYDWTQFDIHFFLDANPEVVFKKWATSSGLASFSVKNSVATTVSGEKRNSDSIFLAGDKYQWSWFFDYISSGSFTQIVDGQRIEFTFGQGRVSIELRPYNSGTLLHLRQSGIGLTDKEKVNVHLDCRGGWIYFLTNLKAVLEHGVDVRDKRADTAQSLEVGWQPPLLF